MIFKKITIKNFLQYSSKQEVNFRNKDNSINVIFGENGAGKSGFIKAIKWCLFGKLNDEKLDGDANYLNLLNSHSKRNHIYDIEVSLFIQLNDKDYVITRTKKLKEGITQYQSVKDLENDDFKITINGNIIANNKKEVIINELISEEMMTFIFLQGEEIHTIYNNQKHIKKCIEASLRLPQIKKTISILQAVTKELRADVAKKGFSNKDFENMQKTKEELDKQQDILNTYQDAYNQYTSQIDKFNEKYEQHFDSFEQRERLQEDILKIKEKSNELKQEVKASTANLWKGIIQQDVEKFVNANPSNLNIDNNQLLDLLNESINNLSCPICDQSTAQIIENLKHKLNQNNKEDSYKSDYSKIFQNNFLNQFDQLDHYKNLVTNHDEIKLELILKQEELKNIKLNSSHKDYNADKNQYESAFGMKLKIEKDIEDTKKYIGELEQKISVYENLLKNDTNKRTEIEEQLMRVDSYNKFFVSLQNLLIQRTKINVENAANEVFAKILGDARYRLSINQDFKLEMFEAVENGNLHEPSTGQKVVIMYALIYAFRKVASFNGALFIDNVFPNLSIKIKRETLDTIPKLFNNIILIQLYDTDELNNKIKEISDNIYHIDTNKNNSYSEIIE